MNDEKIKKLKNEYKITDEKLMEMGIIPKKKSLIQGAVTKSEKKLLKEHISEINKKMENQTDASKEIRKVINAIMEEKSVNLIKDSINYVITSKDTVEAKVPVLIEEDKLSTLKKICKKNEIKVSNIIRCCVIYITKPKS